VVVTPQSQEKSLPLTAKPKKVKKGKATNLLGTIDPCTAATRNDVIQFRKGAKTIASLPVDDFCQARFRWRLWRPASFSALSPADGDSGEATSNVQTVRTKKAKGKGKGT
jgi:hypothetical protein